MKHHELKKTPHYRRNILVKNPKLQARSTVLDSAHQKQIRNALQPNCTTINAIIVTKTTKYGSVHRSGTLHHKPSCKNTERSQKTTKGHKRPPRIQMSPRDETEEVTKNKNDQSNPKNKGKHRSPQCHWLPVTGFRGFKIQILIKFTVRPSHVQSQNHLQKEWSNSPKAHT